MASELGRASGRNSSLHLTRCSTCVTTRSIQTLAHLAVSKMKAMRSSDSWHAVQPREATLIFTRLDTCCAHPSVSITGHTSGRVVQSAWLLHAKASVT